MHDLPASVWWLYAYIGPIAFSFMLVTMTVDKDVIARLQATLDSMVEQFHEFRDEVRQDIRGMTVNNMQFIERFSALCQTVSDLVLRVSKLEDEQQKINQWRYQVSGRTVADDLQQVRNDKAKSEQQEPLSTKVLLGIVTVIGAIIALLVMLVEKVIVPLLTGHP